MTDVTVTIRLLNGDLLTVCGEEPMSGEALYREVYALLSDMAPPPLDAWRLMLLREGEWLPPHPGTAGLQDGEVLDLWIEGDWRVTVECEGYITDFLHMRLVVRGAMDREIEFYVDNNTGRWFYPHEMIVEGDVRWCAMKGRRGRYDYRYLAQDVGANPCVEEYVFACLFCQFHDTLPADPAMEPIPFVRALVEARMAME